MYIIFEDHENSDLSKLFRRLYPKNISDKFEYTRRNTQIRNRIDLLVEKMKNNGNIEDIVIYLDMPPGSPDIVGEYNRIRKKSARLLKEHKIKIIVIPIVCAEYYIIRMVYKLGIFNNKRVMLAECVNREFFKNSELMKMLTEQQKQECYTFENYCKFILNPGLGNCFKSSVKERSTIGSFYRDTCSIICCADEETEVKCRGLDRDDISFNTLVEYPIIPSGIEVEKEDILYTKYETFGEVIEVHNRLIDEFNKWVRDFEQKDNISENDKKMYYKSVEQFKFEDDIYDDKLV